MNESDYIVIEELPDGVGAVSTTRNGGVSEASFDSLNLGFHVGDDPALVRENRRRLVSESGQDIRYAWLSQVHGTNVVDAVEVIELPQPIEADASVTRSSGVACTVMTADCLPVLFWDRSGTVVAAAHAGWRGLASGVIEATVAAMETTPENIRAWLGPAIGPDVFEVGDDVRHAFIDSDNGAESCFRPSPFHPDDRWVADLYDLCRRRLKKIGVNAIYGGDACTYRDEERFFSYRRDGETGRMASAIWLWP